MRARKVKDLKTTLVKKGFELNPEKDHHAFYYLVVEGKKHGIYTYFSHGEKEYTPALMGRIKKQLKFRESALAEDFFDCPMSLEQYLEMLAANGEL